MTHCSSGAGHLPSSLWQDAGRGHGAEGRLTDRALALWWPLSSEPPSPSSTRLLPPPDCPERRLRGQSPCPSANKEGRSASGADGVQAEGAGEGRTGKPPSPPCPLPPTSFSTQGVAMRKAHCALQTTSLGLGGPGYLQLGQRLHSGPGSHDLERPRRLLGWWTAEAEALPCPGFARVALPAPGPSWAVPGCGRKQGLVWLREREARSCRPARPGSVERGPHCPGPDPAGLRDVCAPGVA